MSKTERLFHPRTLVIHLISKNLEEFIVSIPERFQRNEGTVFTKGAMNCGKWNTMAKNMLSNPFTAPPYQPICIWHISSIQGKTLLRPCRNAAENRCRHSATGGIYEYTFRAAVRSKVIISASSPPAPTFTTTCSHSNSTTPRKYSAP